MSITKTTINYSPLYKNHNIRGSDKVSQWGKKGKKKWLLSNLGLKSAIMKIPELNHQCH